VFEITYDANCPSREILDCQSVFEMGIHAFDGVMDFEENKNAPAELSQNLQGLLDMGPGGAEDKDKWQLLSRELA